MEQSYWHLAEPDLYHVKNVASLSSRMLPELALPYDGPELGAWFLVIS